jgi:hypothetical protein
MKAPVIFFLILLFQLSGICGTAHAGASLTKIGFSLAGDFREKQLVEKLHVIEPALISENASIPGENAPLIQADDGDDDENFVRRQLVCSRYFATLCRSFIDYLRYSYDVHDLTFYRHPFYTGSCKYLKQRVLRI